EYFVSYYDYYQPEAMCLQAIRISKKDSSVNDEIDKLRHSATSSATPLFPVEQAPVEKEAFDLHVLGTPPAFVLSQDQTLIKSSNILRLLSSICLLAYCLLVKNVCCLELNQDALHIWFVLLCSVFKGLIFLF
ncbi:hypothetical protein EFP6CSP_16855, partial [Enterococcus faecium]